MSVATHAAADIGAARSNELLRFGAGHRLERSGKNEGLAGKGIPALEGTPPRGRIPSARSRSNISLPLGVENQSSAALAATGPTLAIASRLRESFRLAFSAKPAAMSRPPISSACSMSL